jgi:uncharacterized protein involved in exopolysaccharide biosynthesis
VGRRREPEGLLRHLAFAAGAVRRRWPLVVGTCAAMVTLAGLAVLVLPPQYEVTCRIVFRPSPVLVLRADRDRDGSPMDGASDIIWKAENRRKMIVDTGAVAAFEARRAPLLRLKDRIVELLRGPRTEDQKLDGLVGMLEDRLRVWSDQPDTVVIRVRWPDAEMAARLAEAAKKNFLDERYAAEVQAVEKLVTILEEHAAGVAAKVNGQIADLARLGEAERAEILAVNALDPARSRPAVPRELKLLQDELAEKERLLSGMEEARRMQLAALRTRMTEERAEYSELHPVVIGLGQRIQGLENESEVMARMRREQRNLRDTVDELTGRIEERRPEAREAREDRPFLASLRQRGGAPANNRIAVAAMEVEAARAHVQALRIEADTARAAFPDRYLVVDPPLVPEHPRSPDAPRVLLAALVVGLLLGGFTAVLTEVRHGALRARWQLERVLGGAAPVVEVRLW